MPSEDASLDSTTRCIYCWQEKPNQDFSLEHIIPQFLGGAYAPDRYKTREVCRRCNSNLGLFVDASFEKNYLVTNQLRKIASATIGPDSTVGVPLLCLGIFAHVPAPPHMRAEDVCESWLGPNGEPVYWIRPRDDRLFAYAGGNPIALKQQESRAYYVFSENSHQNALATWHSFRDSFSRLAIKKIMCTKVTGANPQEIGFAEPDSVDLDRIRYFLSVGSNVPAEGYHHQVSFATNFDHRFLSKLALGMAFSLFGRKVLATDYARQLRGGLWYRDGQAPPEILGTAAFSGSFDDKFKKAIGLENTVTLTILPIPNYVALNLNIDAKLNWSIACASREKLTEHDIAPIANGAVLVLNPGLAQTVTLAFPDFVAHKIGNLSNAQLSAMLSRIRP